MARDPARKPILWAFSLSRLDELLERVIPEYRDVAEIRVFHHGFEDALAVARARMKAGEEVDVFVSGGANAAYLRAHGEVPVVTIAPTGFDVLRALATARRLSNRVGIVSFGATVPELEQFGDLYGLDIQQRAYSTVAEAESCVRDLAARGVEVVVGPSAVADLATQAGLKGVFVYSETSAREAIGRAIEIARIARAEEAKRGHVDAVLRHLHEGVIAVAHDERIESLNPAMERLLGVARDDAVGLPLSQVARDLSLARVLRTGEAELEGVQRLGRRTLVTNRIPLRQGGAVTGAVLSCQDATAIERVDRTLRSRHRPRRFAPKYQLSDVVGVSPAIRRARSLAERYARSDATVLIVGESGTGKELFAQGIHGASARRGRPFVAVNCASLPETLLESELFGYDEGAFTGSRRGGKPGLFEAAHTGTLFLDEVGDVPLALQSRLLRVLQEREVLRLGSNDPTPVDVRVVAATNRDLRRRIADGAFRVDLFYRLEILKLELPALAQRRGDVALLARHLLDAALRRHRAGGRAEEALLLLRPHLERHPWPGNVRELENVLERVAVLYGDADGRPVDAGEVAGVVPELFERRSPESLRALRSGDEEEHVRRVLEECRGNQSEAARRLGIGRTTLWRKLNRSSLQGVR